MPAPAVWLAKTMWLVSLFFRFCSDAVVFRKRLAVVTGAGSGIGEALVEQLAALGNLFVLATVRNKTEAVVRQERAMRARGVDVKYLELDVGNIVELMTFVTMVLHPNWQWGGGRWFVELCLKVLSEANLNVFY